MRSVRLTLAVVVAITLSAACTNPSKSQHPGGDIGRHLLNALTPVVAAVPQDAHVAYVKKDEPVWESCDGRAGTFGWGDVDVQVSFTSPLAPSAVFAYADNALAKEAWTRVSLGEPDGPGLRSTWTKVIPPAAEPVKVVLSNNTPYRDWVLLATATPIGHPVHGC
jgi:hypothetical protein